MHDAAGWLEEYRALWEGRLDSLETYLEQTQRDDQDKTSRVRKESD